ncbi:hypothetical protein FAI40_00730 [Acetobacteraceae bacterium]|nr:hypothetical protein FAI40_00730 [Acetobacteraceae bacterium]
MPPLTLSPPPSGLTNQTFVDTEALHHATDIFTLDFLRDICQTSDESLLKQIQNVILSHYSRSSSFGVNFRKDLDEVLIMGGKIGFFVGQSLPDDPTEDRAILAAERALNTPLLEHRTIHGAQGIIILTKFRKGDDYIRLKELIRARDYIEEDAVKNDIQRQGIFQILEMDEIEKGCIEISIIATFS